MPTKNVSAAARALRFTDGMQTLGTQGALDGQVLTWDTGTSTWRAETITLGSAAVLDSLTIVEPTGATVTQKVATADVRDICALTVADVKVAGAIPGWATANDTNLTGAIAAGTFTLTKADAGAITSRQNGTCEMFYALQTPCYDELVVRMSTTATVDYNVAGINVWSGNSFCLGFAQWNTTLELYDDGGTATLLTRTISAGAYVWQKVVRVGSIITFYYSLKTTEPTATSYSTADEATHWVYAGQGTVQVTLPNARPRLGVFLCYSFAARQGFTVTMTACRYTRFA